MVGVSCVGAESLGRLWGREDPSMKGLPNFPGHEAGSLANAESSSAICWCRSPSHPVVERRLVECCCSGLPMKSLGKRCGRTSGWR